MGGKHMGEIHIFCGEVDGSEYHRHTGGGGYAEEAGVPLRGERAGTFGSNGQGETGGGVEPVDELPGEIALALVAVDRHTPYGPEDNPEWKENQVLFIRKPALRPIDA